MACSQKCYEWLTDYCVPGNAVPTVEITLGTPFPGVPAGNDPWGITDAVSSCDWFSTRLRLILLEYIIHVFILYWHWKVTSWSSFLARDSIYAIARCMPSPVGLSVRLSVRLYVTRMDQSKTVEVRITQPSPQSTPMTSFLALNITAKFQKKNREFSANKSPYLRNGAREDQSYY